MTTRLRPARPDDAPEVARIWWEGWQEAHAGRVPDELVAARTRSSFDSRALERVADTEVLEVDGSVVGFTMLHDDEVEQVFLSSDARGSGNAARLLMGAERRLRAAGHARGWLAVVPDNQRARSFYERRGWRDAGDYTNQARVEGGATVAVPCRRYERELSPLVTASALASRLDEVTVLDVRYRMGGPPGPEEYAAGHVPGAVFVDLDSALASPPGPGGRHPLPQVDVFTEAMRAAGVSMSRPVVVYDGWSGHAAARAWWLLRHLGHPDVRVLDGGWAAWQAAGLPVSTSPDSPEPGDFTPGPPLTPLVTADAVLDVSVLVDARAGERYRGEIEPIDPVAGHVPGAVNVPTAANLTPDGTFRSPAELRELYRSVGAVPGADVAAYCGSGVTACHDLLAMEVAGVEAALYPGSWSEWVHDGTRPVETG